MILIFDFFQWISNNVNNQEQTNLDLLLKRLIFCCFFRNGKTEYNYVNVLSIIATPLLLIARSKLTYNFFLNLNKSLEQTEKNTKGFYNYYFCNMCPGLSNWCTFEFGQPTGWYLIIATELDLNSFWPSPL